MDDIEDSNAIELDDRNFRIDYEVKHHGWAEVSISFEGKSVVREVSYLHDSLLDLARMARNLREGLSNATAVFMDEPGELQLHIDCKSEVANFVVRGYPDWASWGMWNADDFEILLEGSCSRLRIVRQITNSLWRIYEVIGPEEYRQSWGHEFPTDDFDSLTE
ncbi:hypothetical protein GC170_13400 [bacterium]|nr:hypothetical protein [bacterium]